MNEITLMSFGYLYGVPAEADTVFGTRGLPNPYWVEALRHGTGLDKAVRDYVFSTPEAERFFETTLALLRQRIAFYEQYDSPLKTPLLIAVGCSGGKHRSVSMTLRLAEALRAEGRALRVVHRDLEKTLERSAGAVVFTREAGELRFVIVESQGGVHGFPKGRMEAGETEAQTALREIREETGLEPTLLPGFRSADVYPLPEKANTVKQVVYLLAEYEDRPLRPLQTELRGAALMPFADALRALEFPGPRRILTEAYTFLNQ